MSEDNIYENRRRVVAPEGGGSMTKQSMALSTDVNQIIKRWVTSGVVPKGTDRIARYGDFSAGIDYHQACQRVVDAEAAFMSLPAHVRKACNNDAGEFLDMVSDPARRAELEQLGLVEAQVPVVAKAPPEEVPADPEPVDPA